LYTQVSQPQVLTHACHRRGLAQPALVIKVEAGPTKQCYQPTRSEPSSCGRMSNQVMQRNDEVRKRRVPKDAALPFVMNPDRPPMNKSAAYGKEKQKSYIVWLIDNARECSTPRWSPLRQTHGQRVMQVSSWAQYQRCITAYGFSTSSWRSLTLFFRDVLRQRTPTRAHFCTECDPAV
jgi:hypothetical protein